MKNISGIFNSIPLLLQILLGVCNKNANLDVWSESDLDLEDQQVIKADVVRTRQSLSQFKTEQVMLVLNLMIFV